jgi:hypothetical protein
LLAEPKQRLIQLRRIMRDNLWASQPISIWLLGVSAPDRGIARFDDEVNARNPQTCVKMPI